MKPPIAKKDKNQEDQYQWLRDKTWPEVKDKEILSYLKAENEYYNFICEDTKTLEKEIYQELKARVKQNDQSYPVQIDHYQYYYEVKEGQDYSSFFRKNEIQKQLLLDLNVLAADKTSFAAGVIKVSDDHSKLVYSYDEDGSERYTIYVKDLNLDSCQKDKICNTIGSIVWNKKATGFYYVALSENWRPNKVYFHLLGKNQDDDILVFEEKEPGFSLDIDRTSCKQFMLINSGNSESNEIYYLPLFIDNNPELRRTIERKKDHLYTIDRIHNKFYILTNDKGKNFRLVVLNAGKEFNESNFQEIVAHNPDHYLVDLSLYKNYYVLTKQILGINHLYYFSRDDDQFIDEITFNEEVYSVHSVYTDKDDKFFRIHYSSLTTPKSVLEFDPVNKILHTRKTDEIPSGYNQELYQAERIWADAEDGTQIPLSIVYRKDKFEKNSPSNLLLYGYGSYGYGIDPGFRPNIISLLDRGFIYVIAHIRGGDELGYQWYESAKFLNKKLTFTDFISAAECLINRQYTSRDKLAIMGGSAGGMLMGVVANFRPELFKTIVALVPFVDVLNTMLDTSLPLTPPEFTEWGNPADPQYYKYIQSYSPYDNVEKKNYPHMLVTAGLTDPRVGYWEAAKWVAKLRMNKLDNNLLLLKTEMDAGHKGQSGRFKGLEEVAEIYSFIIKTINL